MHQRLLDFTPRDPHIDPEDVARVTGQNAVILDILRHGSATNTQLARVSLKYTSRISDLRAAGYRIKCERCDRGLTVYTLEM